jgi:hypothetical protein
MSMKTVRKQCQMSESTFARFWIIQIDDCKYLKMLVDSIPRRLEEVIERQGASIKYLDPSEQKI